MQTNEITSWVDASLRELTRSRDANAAITPQSALLRTKPSDASESDLSFALRLQLAKLTQNPHKTPDETYDPRAASLRQANSDELSKLMEAYRFRLHPAELASWRPTKRVRGHIPGIAPTLEALATDGNLAIFLSLGPLTSGEATLLGHCQRFEWAKTTESGETTYVLGQLPPLFGTENKAKSVAKRPKKLSAKRKAELILESI